MMSVDDVVDILAVNLLGVIPDDEQIVISTNKGEPLAGSNTTSGNAYIDICKRILGDSIPLTDYNTSIRRNPFKRLFRKNMHKGVSGRNERYQGNQQCCKL